MIDIIPEPSNVIPEHGNTSLPIALLAGLANITAELSEIAYPFGRDTIVFALSTFYNVFLLLQSIADGFYYSLSVLIYLYIFKCLLMYAWRTIVEGSKVN